MSEMAGNIGPGRARIGLSMAPCVGFRTYYFFASNGTNRERQILLGNGEAEIGKHLKELFSQTRGGWTLV
jgi:hypothetical protein